MWYKNVDTSFFRFVTIHAFVRQTDKRTKGLLTIPIVLLLLTWHDSPTVCVSDQLINQSVIFRVALISNATARSTIGAYAIRERKVGKLAN